MSSELPFVLHAGEGESIAMYNRIAALERIKFLTGVDLRDRSTEYKQLIDCELYTRFYKDEAPNIIISEEWCQRVAEIVNTLEKEKKEDLDKTLEVVPARVKQLYTENLRAISMQSSRELIDPKNYILKNRQHAKPAFYTILENIRKAFSNKKDEYGIRRSST